MMSIEPAMTPVGCGSECSGAQERGECAACRGKAKHRVGSMVEVGGMTMVGVDVKHMDAGPRACPSRLRRW